MVIDKNTTLMHTFSKGMNTDTSDAYLEEGSYRLANNLRYITNLEENSGELHMIEGATLLASIPNNATVLAATQLRDTGVIVTSGAGEKDWLIYTIENGSSEVTKIVDVDNEGLDRVVGHKLSIVVKWEEDDNKKIYIADGKGPIITLFLKAQGVRYISDIVAYPKATFKSPRFAGLVDGNLKAGMYEYSYQYYIKHGQLIEISPATKLIPLHNGALTINNSNRVLGYELDAKTNKGIAIDIPTDNTFDRLIIYRIRYAEVGVPPIIETVFDEDMPQGENGYFKFLDTGKDSLNIISLEEYNMMTGIHIIPKTIESMTDYMFAANILNDNPIYESDKFKQQLDNIHITYKFLVATLVGDLNTSDSYISIGQKQTAVNKARTRNTDDVENNNPDENEVVDNDIPNEDDNGGGSGTSIIVAKDTIPFSTSVNVDIYTKTESSVTKEGTKTANLSSFIRIAEGGDTNNTYANPFVSYSMKSLRRGETYRYGIIMYDKYHNATAVKHIEDIVVPTIELIPAFSYGEDEVLYVHPIGIEFTVENLPDGICSYEIVRCGKDLSNMSTIMQCVISRPILKIFDIGDLADDEEATQATSQILTPTGFVTNMDCWYGTWWRNTDRPGDFWIGSIYDNDYYANHGCACFAATNSSLSKLYVDWSKDGIKGNDKIFLIISPEYCYTSESVKDMLQKNTLTIDPLLYLYPNIHRQNKTILFTALYGGAFDGQYFGTGLPSILYTNVGNKWSNVIIKDITDKVLESGNQKALSILAGSETIACYYSPYGTTSGELKHSEFKQVYGSIDNRYEYIKLYKQSQKADIDSSINITSLGYPESLSWDDFATSTEGWLLKYVDRVTGIGGKSFCNWVSGGLYNVIRDQEVGDVKFSDEPDDLLTAYSQVSSMMGPGGKCMLAAVDNSYLSKVPNQDIIMGTYLCNIKQSGGGYKIDPKYSTYRSYGNYYDSTKTVVDVFDGDCYIEPFEYVSQHKWYHPYLVNNRNALIVYSIPMETNINLAYTHGYELSKYINASEGDITNIQVNPSNVNNSFIQDKPLYAYNSVYSANSTSRTLAAEDSTNEDWFDSKFDYRVFNSMSKSNDETVDNWLKFLPANYIDVDTRYGEITGLRKFVNHLVFWQENATGLLSVNERVQISDNENMPLTLGTADVLSRYDYMNTSNGMRKDEYADTQSDTTLYWWDHNKHEILGYSGGTQVVSVSKAKFALNFLNEMYAKGNLINKPLLWHDKQFNEVGFTVSDGDAEKNGTLMFGENVGGFTSLYSVEPTAAITFKDSTLLLNENGTIYKWNSLASDGVKGIAGEPIYPYLKYVVNANSVYTKVFDNAEIAGRLYGGGDTRTYLNADPLNKLSFVFKTPLKQTGVITGDKIDNTEYNFRFAIPRDADAQYGGRLRGKTMLAELKSTSNSYDFSLQCIMTKYRISWA